MTAERVVLLRHGRTPSNAAGVWQGQLDVPLDDVGVAQAARTARVLAALPPVRIVASDLSRAVATAAALAVDSGVPVETDAAFREVHAGDWQGLTGDQIDERWPSERAAWLAGEDVRLGGGESRSEASTRVAAALHREVDATPSGVLVVVGHGGSLRGGMLAFLGATGDDGRWLGRFGNCHWAELRPRGDRWDLARWNVSVPDGAATTDVPATPSDRGVD